MQKVKVLNCLKGKKHTIINTDTIVSILKVRKILHTQSTNRMRPYCLYKKNINQGRRPKLVSLNIPAANRHRLMNEVTSLQHQCHTCFDGSHGDQLSTVN